MTTLDQAPPSVREWLLRHYAGKRISIPRRVIDRGAIVADLARMSYRATARKHGVSTDTVRRVAETCQL